MRTGLDAKRPAHRSRSAAASVTRRLSGDGPAMRAFSRSPVAHPMTSRQPNSSAERSASRAHASVASGSPAK